MPIMNDRRSVAANTTVDNVLAGKIDEFLKMNSVVQLYANAEAVGLNVSLIVGSQVIVDDQEVANRAAGVAIVKPDDFIISTGGLAGDRMILRLRNTTGAAIITRTQVAVDPA
jgi:hypothetical protein